MSPLRVWYIYDSWGNTLSVQDGNGQEITSQNDIANLNPFRYRGYYLDSETIYSAVITILRLLDYKVQIFFNIAEIILLIILIQSVNLF